MHSLTLAAVALLPCLACSCYCHWPPARRLFRSWAGSAGLLWRAPCQLLFGALCVSKVGAQPLQLTVSQHSMSR